MTSSTTTTTTTTTSTTRNRAYWLRLTLTGIFLGAAGVLMMGLSMLFAETTPQGDFRHVGDYVLTASALPQGLGLFLATLGFHRLHVGKDGRLGTVGVWIYGLCMTELVVQCMASVAVGAELIWGPAYPMCAAGLMVGLALVVAGSWRIGLLPKWMLALWPPLGLLGSFGGVSAIPLCFALFLVVMAVVLPARLPRVEAP